MPRPPSRLTPRPPRRLPPATRRDLAESGATVDAAEEAVPPNLVGYGAAPRAGGRPQRRARIAAASASSASDTAVLEAAPHDVLHAPDTMDVPIERPKSTPPVRKLAKDLGIDLALVEPTGELGLITRTDVEAYAERVGRAGSATAESAEEPVELVPASPAGALRRHRVARAPHPDPRGPQAHR